MAYADDKIEAVITCVNYADFLEQSLPFNLSHLDRVVVVTSFDDDHTRAVCAKWSVECISTEAFHEKGDVFNKGHGINMGLQFLRQTGWIMQMDADIVLPLSFRNMLGKSGLKHDCLYGAARANVNGWDAWEKVKRDMFSTPQFGYNCLVDSPPENPIGATLVHKQYGYCPIGYFQLWHSSFMKKFNIRYPDVQGSAEKDDVQFALRWPRAKRIQLPTVRVFHLDSEESTTMGANWNGRKTKPFTVDGNPPVVPIIKNY